MATTAYTSPFLQKIQEARESVRTAPTSSSVGALNALAPRAVPWEEALSLIRPVQSAYNPPVYTPAANLLPTEPVKLLAATPQETLAAEIAANTNSGKVFSSRTPATSAPQYKNSFIMPTGPENNLVNALYAIGTNLDPLSNEAYAETPATPIYASEASQPAASVAPASATVDNNLLTGMGLQSTPSGQVIDAYERQRPSTVVAPDNALLTGMGLQRNSAGQITDARERQTPSATVAPDNSLLVGMGLQRNASGQITDAYDRNASANAYTDASRAIAEDFMNRQESSSSTPQADAAASTIFAPVTRKRPNSRRTVTSRPRKTSAEARNIADENRARSGIAQNYPRAPEYLTDADVAAIQRFENQQKSAPAFSNDDLAVYDWKTGKPKLDAFGYQIRSADPRDHIGDPRWGSRGQGLTPEQAEELDWYYRN